MSDGIKATDLTLTRISHKLSANLNNLSRHLRPQWASPCRLDNVLGPLWANLSQHLVHLHPRFYEKYGLIPLSNVEREKAPPKTLDLFPKFSEAPLSLGIKGCVQLISPTLSKDQVIQIYREAFAKIPSCNAFPSLIATLCKENKDAESVLLAILYVLVTEANEQCQNEEKLLEKVLKTLFQQMGVSDHPLQQYLPCGDFDEIKQRWEESLKTVAAKIVQLYEKGDQHKSSFNEIAKKNVPEFLAYILAIAMTPEKEKFGLKPLSHLPLSRQISHIGKACLRKVMSFVEMHLGSTAEKAANLFAFVSVLFSLESDSNEPTPFLIHQMVLFILINHLAVEDEKGDWNTILEESMRALSKQFLGNIDFQVKKRSYPQGYQLLAKETIATLREKLSNSESAELTEDKETFEIFQMVAKGNSKEHQHLWDFLQSQTEMIFVDLHEKLEQRRGIARPSFYRFAPALIRSAHSLQTGKLNVQRVSTKLLQVLYPNHEQDLPFPEEMKGLVWNFLEKEAVPVAISKCEEVFKDPKLRWKMIYSIVSEKQYEDFSEEEIKQKFQDELAKGVVENSRIQLNEIWELWSYKINIQMDRFFGSHAEKLREVGNTTFLCVLREAIIRFIVDPLLSALEHYRAKQMGKQFVYLIDKNLEGEMGIAVLDALMETMELTRISHKY